MTFEISKLFRKKDCPYWIFFFMARSGQAWQEGEFHMSDIILAIEAGYDLRERVREELLRTLRFLNARQGRRGLDGFNSKEIRAAVEELFAAVQKPVDLMETDL